jgi:hypothetical protein
MSASSSIDAYDAQMLDFSSDPDITMNITGSTEFFAEALMDHDGHLATSTYGEHPSIEVDMEEYVGDNAEYEMADETAEYHRSHGDELLDIEVYDASHAPSPLVPPQPLQSSVDVPIDSAHSVSATPAFTEHIALPDKPQFEVHPTPLDHPASDVTHVESSASVEGVSLDVVSSELVHPAEAPAESTLPISESHEQLGDAASTNGQPFEMPAPADAVEEAETHVPSVAEEHTITSDAAQQEAPEPPTAELALLASTAEAFGSGTPSLQDERAADQAAATEGEAVDPLHISDGVYIDPPPAVLLSIADLSHPKFVLFNQPHVEGEGESEGESASELYDNRQAYSLLLENRPTLYYESLSSVFEALRQDEALLSRVPHSFEGELVLDAYDLQLVVSEDNVHSREISLHDLNILHDGSDFVGPLRLFLRAIVPRFIIRYYALQEQVQRLNVAGETGEGAHEEEHHEQYETGVEEQHVPQQGEAIALTLVTAVSDGPEVPPTTEAEEKPAKEPEYPPEPTEEVPQESNETEEPSGVQELAAEYHEVSEEATRVLEEEDDFDGTNAGDEDEPAKSKCLDADQVHDTAAEDIDTRATVTGQGSEFGGEQTEYLDCVQPEEYDERYGEDLPERASGASPVQYGELLHYEEEGEQDTSTAVDETQAVLPGSDEDEEKSAATPVSARAVLEPGSSEPTDDKANESILPEQHGSIPSSEELTTSEPTNKVVHEQASSNQDTDTAQAKIISEVEESDSNFVAMLEREADAEFERTFNNAEQKEQGSIAATLPHDLNWDEWDDEDAEGEDEEDWIDPDVASNESSVTLSSKASKRSHDEVDPSEEVCVEDPYTSPGSKRPRVQ